MLSLIFEIIGICFLVAGTLGMIFYKADLIKLHYMGISATTGIGFIVLANLIKYTEYLTKWIFILVLIVITGPISSMAIAKGIYDRNKRKK